MVKAGIGETYFSNTFPDLEPFSALILNHLTSPLEALFLLPKDAPPQMLKALISAQLDLSKEDYLFLLDKITEKNKNISIIKDTEGYHTLILPKAPPIILHFNDSTKRLTMLLSMAGATRQILDESLTALTKAETHPMYNLEKKIDEQRQGLFIWFNLEKILVFLKPQMTKLEKWGLTNARGIALGWGINNGKGRLKLMLDLPRTAYLSLLPTVANNLNIKTTNPKTMFFLSIPSFEILQGIKEIAMKENNGDLIDAIKKLEEITEEQVGMSLELLLKALGPECVAFSDDTGDFLAMRLGSKENFNQILQVLKEKYGLEHTTYINNGETYNHVEFSLPIPQNPGTSPVATELMKQVSKSHFFWVEEGDFLVFPRYPKLFLKEKQPLSPFPLSIGW